MLEPHGSTRTASRGFALLGVPELEVGSDELLEVFAEGDSYISDALVDDVLIGYESANGATFEKMVFRSCEFEQVDFRDCTFRDVRFEGCRLIGCVMDKAWLNRVDLRDCSAPGLSLLQARLAQVSVYATDLSYANLSETSIDHLSVRGSKLREAALQRVKLKHVALEDCDLTRLDVFGTRLAGIDFSSCAFQAPVLSADYHELRGALVGPEQAVELARLLGVVITED